MPLDIFQQVFTLSLASNLINDCTNTQACLQTALQGELTRLLPTIGDPASGEWQLAWGPVVWKYEPENADTGPENSWFVAFHPRLQFEDGKTYPTYVIAIAGTPAKSTYVWLKQNFAINSVADFNAWVDGGIENAPSPVPAKDIVEGNAYIATGTARAVHLLLTTRAPSSAVAGDTTLLEFIASLDNSNSPRFIATGHSLGGALSPSLALALVSAGRIPANRTLTYPSAGPSPGGVGFTKLFSQTFPPTPSNVEGASSYQAWNRNLVNRLDIVPQAWCVRGSVCPEQNLGNIPPIYGTPLLPPVTGATFFFSLVSLSSGVRYKPLPSQFFTGPAPPLPPTSLAEFVQLFAFPQHLLAYLEVVGVPIPTLSDSTALAVGPHRKSKAEIMYNYPVISDFEWELEHPKEAQKIIDDAERSTEGRALLQEIA